MPVSALGSTPQRAPLAPFLHRHGHHIRFDTQESALLEGSALLAHREDVGGCIRSQIDAETRPWIVASGWACYARTLKDGRRQIFSFIVPGDTIGLTGGPYARTGLEIVALTGVVLLDASALKRALIKPNGEYNSIRSACDAEQGQQESRLLDQVVRLGQLSSMQRTGHLMLEMHRRMDRAGLAENGHFHFPITQFQMGEILGLSLVHINRILQALRHRGLLAIYNGTAVIPDIRGLEQATAT